jgi:hypothetical protein
MAGTGEKANGNLHTDTNRLILQYSQTDSANKLADLSNNAFFREHV